MTVGLDDAFGCAPDFVHREAKKSSSPGTYSVYSEYSVVHLREGFNFQPGFCLGLEILDFRPELFLGFFVHSINEKDAV